MIARTAALLWSLAVAHATLELTPDNWQDATAGKRLFVKFLFRHSELVDTAASRLDLPQLGLVTVY